LKEAVMKKAGLFIAAVLVVVLAAGSGFAAPAHPGHGGHHGYYHGGFGFYGGRIGIGIASPAIYAGAYPAACGTRCYDRVVPTCGSNIEGEQVCSNTIVRTCGRYCY
jgi:hypothetical protein